MNSKLLLRARKYEEIYGEKITPEERPLFHVTPTVGWLNDPNGFSYYKGEYHLFYQYHPYKTVWGNMHWGHLTTKDFIRWERLPAAMAPDEKYDNAGVFSGSALELPDGRHLLMYTGVEEWQREDGLIESRQTQCMAYGDGVDYVKYSGNPVITVDSLPAGSSAQDFRDPKIWWDGEEQCFYAVVANRVADDSGAILLFRSPDSMQWEYVTVLDRCRNQYGRMWECPDFFQLDGMAVLITSPMEMTARGLEFHNGNNVVYITGSYDKKTHSFDRTEVHALDYGLDFYAPQTVEAPDGRRILIGWMQSPETGHNKPQGVRWFGQLTIPRELGMKDGLLLQNPVRELEQYRSEPVLYRDVYVRERLCLPSVSGRTVDMTVFVRPAGGSLYQRFTIKVAKDTEFYTSITYDPMNSVLRFDRSNSGFRHNIVSTRKAPVRYQNGEIKLRILLDRFSVEIFVNDGEQTLTSTLYTPQEADSISFEAVGSAMMDVEKYDVVLPTED